MLLRNFECEKSSVAHWQILDDVVYDTLAGELKSSIATTKVPEFGHAYHLRGSFSRLCGYVTSQGMLFPGTFGFEGCPTDESPRSEEARVFRAFAALREDIQRLHNIIHHENWLTQTLLRQALIEPAQWQSYVKSDIHLFHSELRSSFDHVANVIAQQDGSLPFSFSKLQTGIRKRKFQTCISLALASCIDECDWFTEIREVRSCIMHQGYDSKVMLDSEAHASVFYLERPLSVGLKVMHPRFKSQLGYVSFPLYSGYYVGRLLAFLNKFSDLILSQYRLSRDYHWQPNFFNATAVSILDAAEHDYGEF